MDNTAHGWEEQHLLKSALGDSAFGVKANGAHPMACCKILSGPPACPCQTVEVPHAITAPRGCEVSTAAASGRACDKRAGGCIVAGMKGRTKGCWRARNRLPAAAHGCPRLPTAGATAQRATTPWQCIPMALLENEPCRF